MWLNNSFYSCELTEDMKITKAENQETLKTDPFNDQVLSNIVTCSVTEHHAEDTYKYGKILLENSKCSISISSTYYSWGLLEVQFKNFERAIEWFEKSIEASNFMCCEEAYHRMAGCYAHLKNYKAAERNFLVAIEIYLADEIPEGWRLLTAPRTKPLEADFVWKDLALVYCCMGRYEEAIKYFADYLEVKPDDWYLLYAIGLCHQKMHDDLRAMGYYYRALKLNPTQAAIYNNLAAVAYNLQKDLPGAVVFVEKGEELLEDMEYLGGNLEATILMNLTQLNRLLNSNDKREFYRGEYVKILGFEIEWGDEEEWGS
jgi:tetratricopeptide (TPR) repeat protein